MTGKEQTFTFFKSKSPIHFFSVLFLLALLLNPFPAESAKPPVGGEGERLPAALLMWPEEGSDYAVLVDKAKQMVFLYHRVSPLEPKRVYPCSTGEKGGAKTRTNDQRTPEGIYFFTKSFQERELSPIYGIRAFPIDYPNPVDDKEGRSGYGIWFHGTNKPLKPRDSNGCIVLQNEHIEELASYIKLYDTPVIISNEIKRVDPATVAQEAEALKNVLEGWRKSWELKDIATYMSYYSPRFRDGKRDWQAWKEYKTRLAAKYKKIRVEIENLRLLRSDGVLVATFTQHYDTELMKSVGFKRLYLQQNSKEWKIIGESFTGQDRSVPPAAPRVTVSPLEGIRTFLDTWVGAWEAKDLATYISCYDQSFRSRGMNLAAWKQHRERLNEKFRTIHVDLKDPKISPVSKHTAVVNFNQTYQADDYRDVGIKKILLVKKGGEWKITKEEWRSLKK